MPDRFFLGLGTGENLNEHVLGDRWPAPAERLELLEEAIEVIRLLWQGGEQTHRGKHHTLDHARLSTLPDEPIPIAVAAAKPLQRSSPAGSATRSSTSIRIRQSWSAIARPAVTGLATVR